MRIKLKDWNGACKYADTVCEGLVTEDRNVKAVPYTLYNGGKGIYLTVTDNKGAPFVEYATGVCENLIEFNRAIDQMASRIVAEC